MESAGIERDVRRALRVLRGELERDVETTLDLAAVARRREELEELRADLDRQLERVQEAAVITLVGATGAGKSTLLNALVGRGVATEGERRPTTSAPVIYRPRDADLRDLVHGLPGEPPLVVDYDPEGSGPWRGQILVDAPDVNSIAAQHREVVSTLAARSDVLVVVAHRQSISELASVAFVDTFAGRRGMLFVLNRSDELTDAARTELLAELRTLAAERWGAADAPVLAVSALRARSRPGGGDWDRLTDVLSDLVRSGRLGRVRRHNALGTAGRVGALYRELEEAGLSQDLEALEEAVGRGLEAWRARVGAELEDRLALRRADLRVLLWNEAARRWEGPGGWALRAGALSGLGLTAGAALVRRHPLLAAGAAAGAVAAGAVREGLRERSLSDPGGLLPGAGELENTYRAELGQARLAAARLTADPATLGVPEGEDLAAGALAAAGEAWSRLLERDLPAAAQESAGPVLRAAVDLPVYGLGGWVLYQVVVGFFQGNYASIDFLLNAALILMAWLLVARTAVRALLGRRAGGLLGTTRAFAGQALAAAGEGAAHRASRAIGHRREALARLGGVDEHWRKGLLGE